MATYGKPIRIYLKTVSFVALAVVLSACDGGQSQISGASQSLNAIAGVQRAAQSEPTQNDLALSCPAIEAELNALYARLAEIDAQQRVIQRKRNIRNGVISTGVSVLGAGAIANAGSVSGIRNAGAAVSAAGAVANGARANGSSSDSQALNQALAVQERAALLERVKVQKGC